MPEVDLWLPTQLLAYGHICSRGTRRGQTRPDSHRTRLPAESKRGTRSDNPGPRFGEARLVTSQRVGNTRLDWADATNPLSSQYREIVISTDGAPAVISQEFGSVRGSRYPYVKGSFASRRLGEPGPAPDDRDVLVIGEPTRDAIHKAAERAEQRTKLPVQVTVRSEQAWQSCVDRFIKEVRSRPLVALFEEAET